MKSATVKELKQELGVRSHTELVELCLQLSRFKKENKELLTYLMYEKSDEPGYIENVKIEIEHQFSEINTASYYYIKKSTRKILRNINKYIRYSKKKETQVELLLYFCSKLRQMSPPMEKSIALHNIYKRQVESIKKTVSTLHEDLQYDYETLIEELI